MTGWEIATGICHDVVLHSKCDKSVRSKCDRFWGWAMNEQNREFFLGRRGCQDGMVAVGMEAANDL